VRGGTAKLLTLLCPATGDVRAKGVLSAPNAVLHPWQHWWWSYERPKPAPALRLLLVWDNLMGHLSYSMVRWLLQHGTLPPYTPLSGSWLNMAESLQRILVRRALSGQHPQSAEPYSRTDRACFSTGTSLQNELANSIGLQMNRYQGALHLFYLPNSYRQIPGARGKHLSIR
jgi:hypothetical protein